MPWITRCAWCSRQFSSDRPRSYCSRKCHDRHAWFGVVPDHLKPRERQETTS